MSQPAECWRPVRDYEGWYEVSSLGNVRSIDREIHYSNGRTRFQKGKAKEIGYDRSGYRVVSLYKNQKMCLKKVHRMVGEAFLDNPDNKPQINHIDGDKSNNRIGNLEWATPGENQQHAISTGLRQHKLGQESTNNVLSEEDVLQVVSLLDEGKTQRAIAKRFGVHFATISAISLGKSWSHLTKRGMKENLMRNVT